MAESKIRGADGYISKDVWGLDLGKRLLEIHQRRRGATIPSLPEVGAPPFTNRRET